jgi:hypothetical protein
MTIYRVWQVKQGEVTTGPFPEKLIFDFILIGRIRDDDLLSMDGHFWRPYREIPDILVEVEQLLGGNDGVDIGWYEERQRAVLRHSDERKHPDRRTTESVTDAAIWQAQREGKERRIVPETVEQHAYRRTIAETDNLLQLRRQRAGITVILLLVSILTIGLAVYHFQAHNPIRVNLQFTATATCGAAPSRGVNWQGCDKSGYLLAGADLREADLSGANLSAANLSYANLSGVRLAGARLQDAILTGATWTDGRVCGEGSVGSCR